VYKYSHYEIILMSQKKIVGRAYGYIQTQSPASRVRQAFANMKAAPEEMISEALELAVALSQKMPIGAAAFKGPKKAGGIFGTADEGEIAQLVRISLEMGKQGANMIIVAALPNATHQETAVDLGQIFNLTYSCTEIMGEAEVPVADIYFKNEMGIYVSKLTSDVPR
jgi:hypothetical protein